MTSPKAISFVVGIFLLGLTLSYLMGGVWFDAGAKTIFGSLTAFKSYNILGFNMPWINADFFTVGLPKVLGFDFAFFGGRYSYFKYVMYIFSVGIIWGFVTIFISLIVQMFWSRR